MPPSGGAGFRGFPDDPDDVTIACHPFGRLGLDSAEDGFAVKLRGLNLSEGRIMSASDEQYSLHWQYYADKSGELNRGAADDYGQGREEQLNETLAFIGTGNRFTTEQRDYLNRIPQNRAKKHRRLRLHTFGHATLDYYDDPNSELLDLVHRTLSPREWAIECRLAEGESYAAVASDIGTSVTAIKMRVSRWREACRQKLSA